MAKVTTKLQVTIPKALAERHHIRPGDEIAWTSAGDVIRIETAGRPQLGIEERLRLFDGTTKRLRRRRWKGGPLKDRGWTREELYTRGRAH